MHLSVNQFIFIETDTLNVANLYFKSNQLIQ